MKIAINGLGRIGRNILKIIFEKRKDQFFEIVAVNEFSNKEQICHFMKYDTVHGRFKGQIETYSSGIVINDKKIKCISEKSTIKLPWKKMNVDLVVDCSGKHTKKIEAYKHIQAGAKKVLISANGDNNIDKTVVFGINEHEIQEENKIISNSSCTTNCLAFLVKALIGKFKIEEGYVNTIHAYTNDQNLIDNYKNDLRRARCANESIIPTTTGSIQSIGKIFKQLDGKIKGVATRVPVKNVSFLDFIFTVSVETDIIEINSILVSFVKQIKYKNLITFNDLPLVSVDFNNTDYSCIFDLTQTNVIGKLVKVSAWYDNEWGYANRMVDMTEFLLFKIKRNVRL